MSGNEVVRFTRPRHVDGLEIVSVTYRGRVFPKHVHDEYVIGTMTEGAERLSIRGEDHVAAQGDLILIEPCEPHSNCSAGTGTFGYVVMYVPVGLMAKSVRDLLGDEAAPLPRFAVPVLRSPALARLLVATHRLLEGPSGRLEQESAFLLFLSELVRQPMPGPDLRPLSRPRAEQHRIRRAREYLNDHFKESVSLLQLAEMAGLSPYHFLRSFREQVGLPPAAYQTHRRVTEAKHLLRNRCSIAEAAAELGFVDQSHLSRHFQRIVGTTPGRYIQQ